MLYSDFAQLLKSDTDAVKMAHALLTDHIVYILCNLTIKITFRF